jgi:hypothetical protein
MNTYVQLFKRTYSRSHSPEKGVYGLVGFAVGLLLFGAGGLFCLLADKNVDNTTVRGLLEGMVVVGLIVGAVYALINAVQQAGTGNPAPPAAQILLNIFFVPTPIYFTVLCWNNVDWHVMTLLSQQFQFRVVGGLSLWIIVMNAWRKADGFEKRDSVFFAICLSILFWSPLLMILFMDAIKRQSKLFRVAMPAVYLLYVMVAYIIYGYIRPPHAIARDINSTATFPTAAAATTFESQIASALSTIMFVMVSFVYNALHDSTGTAVLFPIRFATVLKNAVPFILEAGTWMRTELDEDGQRIVLLSKRTAGVVSDVDDEDGVELQTNLASHADVRHSRTTRE